MLTPEDFASFTQTVHGHPPFPWQAQLVERVLGSNRWPALLDLPTGSGKTAVLDIAVFTLAASALAHDGRPRLPRRIVFVVDRRIVVDQAADHAERLAAALDPESGDGKGDGPGEVVRRTVRDALRGLGSSRPLRISVQRGGIPRDDSWAMRPDQPTIMLSTVDQVGSRLLFRGYGVTDRMRPIHAGLLGSDTLFLLDEVHLSRPFADTLAEVGRLRERSAADGAGSTHWQAVQMSATPGDGRPDAFGLTPMDRDPGVAPLLVQRLAAAKHARILDVPGAGHPEETLPKVVVKHVGSLTGSAVGVVVNRVATARAIAQAIAREWGADRTILLTGRMRPLDRDGLYGRSKHRIRAGRTRDPDAERLVVVATQSIEAGADLDFDAMITECAPIDSLRQRFGRLDRFGDLSYAGRPAEAIILAPKTTVGGRDPDPVYGEGIREAYRFLKHEHGKGIFDVGPESADLTGAPGTAYTSAAAGPLLLAPHLDVLVQTMPRPHIDPDIGPWLHGFQPTDTDVSVIWRADLTDWHLDAQRAAEKPTGGKKIDRPASEVVSACPPSTPEAMQVPISAVRAWLAGEMEAPVVDVEGVPEAPPPPRGDGQFALRWRGAADSEVVRAGDLRPGDTLVVPASRGGISLDNWDPGSAVPVPDLGDQAQLVQRATASVRLHPDVLPAGLAPPAGISPDMDDDELHERIRTWMDAGLADAGPQLPDWFRTTLGHIHRAYPRRVRRQWVRRSSDAVFLVLSTRLPRDPDRVEIDDLDGSDLSNSFTGADTPVLLDQHLDGVGRLAADFALRCGLPQPLVEDLALAGELHDLGKADPRFQRWLHDGDEVAALSADAMLAKSTYDGRDPRARERARRASGYPSGGRHELLSVALVEGVPEILDQAHDRDLVLHLIASHHGYCRPLAPVVVDADPVQVGYEHRGVKLASMSTHELEKVGSGVAARFWRLVRQHGWWGLAHLEAILRLADHRRSQMESERRDGDNHA